VTIVLVIANLALLVVYFSAWTRSGAQGNKKTIQRWPTTLVYPVDITEFKASGKAVNQDEEFEEGPDWVRNLTFKLKNKSNKTITYIMVNVTFPETKAALNGRVVAHQIHLGQDPDNKMEQAPLHLAPEQSMNLSLAPEYDDIKGAVTVQRLPMENISKIIVRLQEVMFDDGSLWSAGILYRRNANPNQPNKWLKVDN
jgi:hypothetical protein